MKSTVRTSFDATLDGQDVCIEFDRVSTYSRGLEGQDADGNRGVWTTTIDEDCAEHIFVTTFEHGVDGHKEIATPLSELGSLLAVEVQRLVDEYLDQHDPDAPEDEEPDYDDQGD